MSALFTTLTATQIAQIVSQFTTAEKVEYFKKHTPSDKNTFLLQAQQRIESDKDYMDQQSPERKRNYNSFTTPDQKARLIDSFRAADKEQERFLSSLGGEHQLTKRQLSHANLRLSGKGLSKKEHSRGSVAGTAGILPVRRDSSENRLSGVEEEESPDNNFSPENSNKLRTFRPGAIKDLAATPPNKEVVKAIRGVFQRF